jgi:hypothetical protein
MISCGHCKGKHDTVAQVRECAGVPARISLDPGVTATGVHFGNPGKFPWTMPEGYYAINGRDGRQTDFYRIDKPGGKWSGWTFVKMVVGGKPDTKVRDHKLLWAILEAIQADPAKAAQRYGVEIGQCYKCNIHLTDEISRALGIGPTCRAKNSAA